MNSKVIIPELCHVTKDVEKLIGDNLREKAHLPTSGKRSAHVPLGKENCIFFIAV